MLSPPPSRSYSNIETLVYAVNQHARGEGYAVVKERTKKNKDNKVYKVYLRYDRGGKYVDKSQPGRRTRDTGTRLINCPFPVTGTVQENGFWKVEARNAEHNHFPSLFASGHSAHRQLSLTINVRQSIADMITAGIQPRPILSSLRQEASDLLLSARDVYNARADIRRQNLGSKTPIQALLALLSEDRQWTTAFELNSTTHQVQRLFFAHSQSIVMVKDFPEVLLLDCTYKTNRFKMPLLVIVGMSSLGTTFYVGFAFLMEEKEQDYTWAMKQVHRVYLGFSMEGPPVHVTDRDLALMNALEQVFPASHGILCAWHIQKNILAKASTTFKKRINGLRL